MAVIRHRFHSKSEKEHKRFYLMPGMGGRAYRRRQKFLLKWSVITGLTVAAILTGLLYWLNRFRWF